MHPVSAQTPGVLAETAAARVSLAAPVARLSLRARQDIGAFSDLFGFDLPGRIGTRDGNGTREALCLGPDEWTVLTTAEDVAQLVTGAAALSASHPHSLVDVSGREVTLVIEGPKAEELLTLGMPRNPRGIAVGEGRRTLFDGVTVVLWRDADTSFRMDVWHSFAPHLLHLLETGCRELAAETV